ncbi:MAG: hypothetical protein HY703_07015 [Gemmatimonadetes bacterium]|nr:hypothetical protein [Gemmatimonadota bacterium]
MEVASFYRRTLHDSRPLVLLLAAALAACASAGAGGPAGSPGEGRAALARITVENHTEHRLSIAFRPAAPPGAEVVVGVVEPNATATVAPVPAGEPIILLARSREGGELRLAPRSFDLDAYWVWVIPADARFSIPGEHAGEAA